MSRVVRSIAALALVAVALPGAAYVRETTNLGSPASGYCLWSGSRSMTFQVNATEATYTPCGDAAAAAAAVAAGLAAWSATEPSSCTDFHFVNGGTTTKRGIGQDGTNLVVFRTRLCSDVAGTDPCRGKWGACGGIYNCWDDQYGVQTIGMTTTTYDPSTGEILDADMELFGWDGANPAPGNPPNASSHYLTCGDSSLPQCTTLGETGCRAVDVSAVATHEGGHMLGLDHVCQYAAPYDPPGSCDTSSVMVPQVGNVAQRALSADDVNGICKIYPRGAATSTCAPPKKDSGGCSSAGGTGLAGLLAATAVAVARQRRRRR